MSWHFSQALVEEYLEASCSDIELSVQSRTTLTHGMFWLPGKTTDVCPRSRSGMTYAPLTDTHGGVLLTLFREAFRARTFPQLAKEPGSRESGQGFGKKWHELSVKYDPDTSGWKTLHCLFPEDLEPSSVILPKWGMIADGALWERTMPGHLTSVTESGFWQTPTVSAAEHPGQVLWKEGQQLRLPQQVNNPHLWPTPRSCSAMSATITPESAWAENRFPNLETVVGQRLWPTPRASDGSHGGPNQRDSSGRPGLSGAVHLWPTPCATDHSERRPPENIHITSTGLPKHIGKNGEKSQMRLSQAVKMNSGGSLNPTWVEWLMNFPIGWTDTGKDCLYEFEFWKEASTTNVPGDSLRKVWFNEEAGAPPQRPEPNKQQFGQRGSAMQSMPRQRAFKGKETNAMPDLQCGILSKQHKAIQAVEAVRESRMFEGTRTPLCRIAVGINARVDRLRCIGNAQVPAVVKLAWETLR